MWEKEKLWTVLCLPRITVRRCAALHSYRLKLRSALCYYINCGTAQFQAKTVQCTMFLNLLWHCTVSG